MKLCQASAKGFVLILGQRHTGEVQASCGPVDIVAYQAA
jgi:hypothetical protein